MFYENDTIYALSTVLGKSGVAVIRISGPNAFNALEKLYSNANKVADRELKFAKLKSYSTGEIIDYGMFVKFKGPNSFTGEDIVELHVHGSIAIIDWILTELRTISGLRPAEAGEFAKRAFMNGKMDLTEAEGLADLIDSETKMQHKQAIRQYEGILHKTYHNWRQSILEALALMEALIDFPEEDLEATTISDIDMRINAVKERISLHLNDNNAGEKIRNGIALAIIGAPNVGKSTLINRLVGRDLAIVANIPGTTRDIIETQINIGGYPFIIADTAGLRIASDVIEAEGIKRTKAKAENADIKIVMFDANYLDNIDIFSQEYASTDNTIIVINKAENINYQFAQEICGKKPILISLQEEYNIHTLTKSLEEYAKNLTNTDGDQAVITRERYRYKLEQTLIALELFDHNLHPEIACEYLRQAANNIGSITGNIDVEDLLDVIFSSFCIGK